MKRKISACLLAGVLSFSSVAFAVSGADASQSQEEKLKIAREQIAEDAAFIRKTNSDPNMTQEEKKSAIAEFIRKQNEKTR
jgi:hypothetical protein